MVSHINIDMDRLMRRIEELGQIGGLEGGGTCRLALTDEDKAGRELVIAWMKELGLEILVDRLGNITGTMPGYHEVAPVMMGSHIDTVGTGGLYDGNLGVLGALEVVDAIKKSGRQLKRPLAVTIFTNEEGVRFQPDMMGSMAWSGMITADFALSCMGNDGKTVGEELERIGFAGDLPMGHIKPEAFLELHIEQGPVLEAEGIAVAAVQGVQGISWTELTIEGQSNHAGTTPMSMRHDAGYVAAGVHVGVREMVKSMGGNQVGTCGRLVLQPNLVNVVNRSAVMTVDLRNTDNASLQMAEDGLKAICDKLAAEEGVNISSRNLVRLEPVNFAPHLIDTIAETAAELGHSCKRMFSGAGHDAGLLSSFCPCGMIFVPSEGGLSHNVKEYTAPEDIAKGAQVFVNAVAKLAT